MCQKNMHRTGNYSFLWQEISKALFWTIIHNNTDYSIVYDYPILNDKQAHIEKTIFDVS